ncbi:hypothetical protein [Thermococcus sp.]
MMEIVLELLFIALALTLVGVSYLAYKKSHLRAALYFLLAFLLLAIKKVVELSKDALRVQRDVSAIVDALEVLVLILFLLALWRR